MGSSFVNIGDHGFWMRDGMLEVWLRLLALQLEPPVAAGDAVGAIRDQFLLASMGAFTGCVPHGLDQAVATPEGAAALRRAIEALLAILQAGPQQIPGHALELLGLPGFTPGIAVGDLVAVGRAFADLVDGRIVWTAKDAPALPYTARDTHSD